jgi:RNA polymerase sigma factor (sigma-70 family)
MRAFYRLVRDGGAASDSELLERFRLYREEAAFAALVHRHGPMVLGVCRRVLRDPHESEDAFQATFLVLVRKAQAVARPELLGNWLYGVALRTAKEARTRAARRRTREQQAMTMPREQTQAEPHELWPIVDEEINRLPARLRVPLVLCELEGVGRQEAARRLGCPQGTLSSRLARARSALRGKLLRRGVALSAGTLAMTRVPSALASATVDNAALFAAGSVGIPDSILTLTQGVLRAMFLAKLKVVTGILVVAGVMGLSAGLWAQSAPVKTPKPAPAVGIKDKKPAPAEDKPAKTEQGKTFATTIQAVDAGKRTITLLVPEPGKKQAKEETFPLAADLKIFLPSLKKTETPAEAKLSDLAADQAAHVQLSLDGKSVVRIALEAPQVRGSIKAVDAGKRTLTVSHVAFAAKTKEAREDTFTVPADVQIHLPSLKKGEKSEPNTLNLADLKEDTAVQLRLSWDRKQALAIAVELPNISGIIKSVDASKRTLTVSYALSKTKDVQEDTFQLAEDAQIHLPIQKLKKGEKSEPNTGKLSDLNEGTPVRLVLSLDRKQALAVSVESPSVQGGVKSVDATKNTITIEFKSKEGAEEQTIEVARDARIHLAGPNGGKAGKLSDILEGNRVVMQLSLDRKVAYSIDASGGAVNGMVKALDLGNRVVTVSLKEDGNIVEKSYDIAKDVDVSGVKEGDNVSLQLSADEKTVLGVSVKKD